MNNYKLVVLFFLKRNRINKMVTCPLRCRIIFLKSRKEFSTGIFINPDYWDSGKQKGLPPNIENTHLNNKLSVIHQQIDTTFLMLQILQNDFDCNPSNQSGLFSIKF